MTVESEIKTHIETQISGAFDDVSVKQVITKFPSAKFRYDLAKGRDDLGSEELQADIIVAHSGYLDRVAFIRAFPHSEIQLDNYDVIQEYKGHHFQDHAMQAGEDGNISVFNLQYTYDIKEDS